MAWLSTENRRRSQFLGPECDVEKAKLSSVSFFQFGKKDDGFGRSLVLVPLRSCSVFSFLILTALLVAIYQGLEGGHFCFSLFFLFSRVSLLSVRNVIAAILYPAPCSKHKEDRLFVCKFPWGQQQSGKTIP